MNKLQKEIAETINEHRTKCKCQECISWNKKFNKLSKEIATIFKINDEQIAIIKNDICYENKIPSTIKQQKQFNEQKFLQTCGNEKC